MKMNAYHSFWLNEKKNISELFLTLKQENLSFDRFSQILFFEQQLDSRMKKNTKKNFSLKYLKKNIKTFSYQKNVLFYFYIA